MAGTRLKSLSKHSGRAESKRLANTLNIPAITWADRFSAFALSVLMNYLTNVWNLSPTHAAGIVNIFSGVRETLAFVFVFCVDAFLGDFYMIVLSSIAYIIGLGLLSFSTPPFFGPCSQYKGECIGHIQKVLLFTALPLIAVERTGVQVSVASFINQQIEYEPKVDEAEAKVQLEPKAPDEAESPSLALIQVSDVGEANAPVEAEVQVEDIIEAPVPALGHESPSEALVPASYVDEAHAPAENGPVDQEENAADNFLVASGLMIVVVVIVGGGVALSYIKPWSIRFGIPAICTLTATVCFLIRSPWYNKKHSRKPEGSPITIGLRVFVAAATKHFHQVSNFTETYKEKVDDTKLTSCLRWLNKAATKFPDQARKKSWTLCSTREVEHTKIGISRVPLLLMFITTGLVLSLRNTYFLEQADHMDRKLGSIKIQMPIFIIFHYCSLFTSQLIFEAFSNCISISRKYLCRIWILVGMVLTVLCCITAAIVETQRLWVIRNHESNEMSVFFLLPQFLLLAAADGITDTGVESFLVEYIPESMHQYARFSKKFVLGIGRMASILLVYVVGKVNERNNSPNWFQHTLDKSRFDRYYWTLAGLSAINLVIYAIVALSYDYKETPSNNHEVEAE